MDSEKQHAIIGKVLSDKREAEKKQAMLKKEAERLGNVLENLAGYLRGNVEYVWFCGASTNEHYPHPRGDVFSVSDVDGQRIAELTSEIRNTMDEIKRLNGEARALGF